MTGTKYDVDLGLLWVVDSLVEYGDVLTSLLAGMGKSRVDDEG